MGYYSIANIMEINMKTNIEIATTLNQIGQYKKEVKQLNKDMSDLESYGKDEKESFDLIQILAGPELVEFTKGDYKSCEIAIFRLDAKKTKLKYKIKKLYGELIKNYSIKVAKYAYFVSNVALLGYIAFVVWRAL